MLDRIYRALGGGERWSLRSSQPWGAQISTSQARSSRLEWALSHVQHLNLNRGLIVECGVGSGASLAHILEKTWRIGWQGPVIGFDSFEGFPEGGPRDNLSFNPDSPSYSIYKSFTELQVRQNLEDSLSGDSRKKLERLQLVQGWIPDSFDGVDLSPGVSLLHLDVDLYEPYRASLEHFWKHMLPGGLVLFDEYDSEVDETRWPGAKSAIDDFCESRNLEISRHWSGLAHLEAR